MYVFLSGWYVMSVSGKNFYLAFSDVELFLVIYITTLQFCNKIFE